MDTRNHPIEGARTAGGSTPATPRRVALYSHDTQGLGHVRRNIELASALVAADPHTDVLLLTGNPEAATLPLPPNTDIGTLPTVRKDADGGYASRAMNGPLETVLRMRAGIIEAALDAFDPHLLIVDKVALGLRDELEPALRMLRARGSGRTVLGLREILDAPDIAVREWEAARTSQSIDRYYDEVWVYGDRGVYDPVVEYRLPDAVAGKIVYTGYLGNGRGLGTATLTRDRPRVAPPAQPYSLCLLGGGQDGLELAESFVRARLPAGQVGVVLTGPFMRRSARHRLHELVARRPDKTLAEFLPNPGDFIERATSVVSMAGYNSVCELLSAGARTLLVPRATPRAEQLLRARRMSELGLVDMVDPADLSARRLGDWLGTAADTTRPRSRPIDLDGLSRVPRLAAELVERAQPTRTEVTTHAA